MPKHMLKVISLVSVFAVLTSVVALAQNSTAHPVEGTYNVESKSNELGTLTFLLVLKRDGAKWIGEIKDAPMPLIITSVTVDEANKVTVVADAGGTAVTLACKFDSGKIAGDWTAGDMKGTLTGAKKDAVVAAVAKSASEATPAATAPAAGAAAAVEGTYDFKIIADGQGEFPLTLVIKNDGGKLVTEIPGGGDLLITGIEVKDGDAVALTATYQGNGPIPLPGKRNGNEMGGKWEFGGFSGTWSAKKK